MSTDLPETEPRLSLVPTPAAVSGTKSPLIEVSEGWQFHPAPGDGFEAPELDVSDWSRITVPGEPAMQGFAIEQDVEMGYRVSVHVPADFADGRTIVRFDGAYSFARVWVNGQFVGEHLGGFTRFDLDVTTVIRPGEVNVIAVGVTDRSDSVSTASSYAAHPIGGILRPVSLMHVPDVHLTQLHVSTPLVDAAAGEFRLVVELAVPDQLDALFARLELRDPQGGILSLGDAHALEFQRSGRAHVDVPLAGISPWSDEAPHLYQLDVTLLGRREVSYQQRVGFRSVAVVGNKLMVNGQSVLLRGVNRHDIHPRLGRMSDGKLERTDLELFKRANINFVRTSHYPPHPALLEAADELGLYVEVENGVCWADQFGWPATQDDPRHAPEYLGPLAEMVERDRNHPSVIIWSIGNESTWGENFVRSFDLVTAADSTRPVIMSFPGGPEHILSSHYPAYGDDLGSTDKPVLHDEVVHLPVYQSGELRRDPGIHVDWAVSIDDFMDRLRAADGGLGIAIWGGIDEQFALPAGMTGFGPWGILDVWRRRKPEWWAVRRAYSPVRVDVGAARAHGDGSIDVAVHNDHSFTNLRDIAVVWCAADGTEGRLPGPDVPPGTGGTIRIPASGDAVELRFESSSGRVLDRQLVGRPSRQRSVPSIPAARPKWSRNEERLIVEGEENCFRLELDCHTGRIVRADAGARSVLTGGLEPHIAGAEITAWETDSVAVTELDEAIEVSVRGRTAEVEMRADITVHGDGRMVVEYELDAAPGAITGRITEIGLTLGLSPDARETEWDADSPNATPSDGFLGRPRGRAVRHAIADPAQFGDAHASWNDVETGSIDRSVVDTWSRDFRARRAGIRCQRVTDEFGAGIELVADGSLSTRLFAARTILRPAEPSIHLEGDWQYRAVDGGLNQGSSGVADHRCDERGGAVIIRFTGAAIDCLGALGPDLGIVDIVLDGETIAAGVDLFSPVDCSGHTIVSAGDLAPGEHELRIEVTGRANRASTGVGVRLHSAEVFDAHPNTNLAIMSRNIYPVSGSFDWFDAAIAETGADGIHAEGSFELRLLGPQR